MAWLATHDAIAVSSVLAIIGLITAVFYKMIPVVSVFGICFLASMVAPSLFLLVWLYELMIASSAALQASWPLFLVIAAAYIVFSLLVIFNSAMLSWIVLARYSALYFRFPRLKEGWQKAEAAPKEYPWISVHVPCYNEPPEVVISTIDALAKISYPNFEVIILDNNTSDPAIWKPVEEYVKGLPDHFRFYHIDKLAGAKAGALNRCLELTSSQVKYISVLDADYVVQPDFLDRLIGFFDDPHIGFVQPCQDYREWAKNPYQGACYFEYATHFKLELCGQNEWDVNYTIGTMCIIRRDLLEKVGGWATWCLTEDSEVAVRIHALGYSGYYLKDTFGRGLIPETFDNYKQQRFRWTAGPVQQFQKHWRMYLPGSSHGKLSTIQKFGEIFHSLSIFFSESLAVLLNVPILAICLWFLLVKEQSFTLPFIIVLFIPLAFIRNILSNWLAIRLLGGNFKDYILSSLALRSLIYTRTQAFYRAWLSPNLQWQRTNKFKTQTSFKRAFQSSRAETIGAGVYCTLAIGLAFFVNFSHPDMIFVLWLGIVNQAISFFCAPIMAILAERNLR